MHTPIARRVGNDAIISGMQSERASGSNTWCACRAFGSCRCQTPTHSEESYNLCQGSAQWPPPEIHQIDLIKTKIKKKPSKTMIQFRFHSLLTIQTFVTFFLIKNNFFCTSNLHLEFCVIKTGFFLHLGQKVDDLWCHSAPLMGFIQLYI
jgi:hypothetical protein